MADIHPQLAHDCIQLGRFDLCHVLLMNDANYPWCILVPDRDGVTEIFQLSGSDRQLLSKESARLGEALMGLFDGDKLNIAALGNLVPQLHIHHVVRYCDDPAWPAPVWGKDVAKPYATADLDAVVRKIKHGIGGWK